VGKACAAVLAKLSVRTTVFDISFDADPGSAVNSTVVDVRDQQQFARAVRTIDGLNGLVACAALPPFHPNSLEILDTNLFSLLENIETFLEYCRAPAMIVLFSSVAGFRCQWPLRVVELYERGTSAGEIRAQEIGFLGGLSGNDAYSFSKRMIAELTIPVARQLVTRHVCVNTILLGPTTSPAADWMMENDSARWEMVIGECPLGAPIDVTAVANAVAFLVSSDARYMTGSVVRIDSGWSLFQSLTTC
jgi:NAD(P)-dependent dehydrogenase (short-subunit alcohol dehydrogenase family)